MRTYVRIAGPSLVPAVPVIMGVGNRGRGVVRSCPAPGNPEAFIVKSGFGP